MIDKRQYSAHDLDAVRRLIKLIGEDPDSDGCRDTPKRVCKALLEMTSGYNEDPAEILSTTFEETSDEMVIVRNIRFVSLCQHHCLPFVGTAAVAYLPDKKVVGLSKIPRLVACFSKRLQIQERITSQITNAIMEHLRPLGAAAVLVANHSCTSCRGIMQHEAEMITSSMIGAFRQQSTRSEFLSLALRK